jgi:hypothetical protein
VLSAGRQISPRALVLAAVAAGVAAPAWAEIRLAPNVVVLEPADVLDRHLTSAGGTDWVEIPGHTPWALVSAMEGGDGAAHHAVDPGRAADAWRAVRAGFRERLALTIVCLPRPRRDLPNSSAEDNLIYLSPGSAPYDASQVGFLLAHEMGHCVHRELLPDSDDAGWARYRRVRGIEDTATYHDWAPHAYRPREIFAEDFRFLFGGRLANYSGSIENRDLPLPDEVPGLAAFMLGLIGESAEADAAGSFDVAALRVFPQPSSGPTTFAVAGGGGAPGAARALRIVDVSGRLVARLAASEGAGSSLLYLWDGRSSAGRRVSPGVFYAMLGGEGPRVGGRIVVTR